MRKSIVILFSCLLYLLQACNQTKKNNETAASYTKADLLKIKWIEGKWRGLAGNEPFYEIYHFINDSCIEITTYEWNGTDSSKTDTDLLQWKDNAYWLGKEQKYKVTNINSTEIKMIPVKAANNILWKKSGADSGWVAILEGKKDTNTYNMKPFNPFEK